MAITILAARAPWYLAGPVVGAIIVLLLWVTNKPLGALGGYIELEAWAARKRRDIGWRSAFIVGVAVGGLVSALASGGVRPTLAYGSFDRVLGATIASKAIVLLVAGALIGIGGRTAGGCTSGHGLCGTSFGSPASVVCTVTFMATAICCAFAMAWIVGG